MFSRIGASAVKIDSRYKINLDGSNLKISLNSKTYDYSLDPKLICEIQPDGSSLKFLPNLEKIRGKACERKLKKIAGFHVRDLQNLLAGLITPFKANIEMKNFCF